MLRQVARKTEDLVDKEQELPRDAGVGIEPAGAQARIDRVAAVPPGHRLRQRVEEAGVEPECAAHVPDGAARAVGDEGGGERRPVAAVAFVDVLDDFLAPLVLEVHVDVRRLVAFRRDETLEQEVHARRVHLRDAQAVAHGRVGRGAPPLAEDAERARVPDDVVNGQEVVLVGELPDQGEFFLEELDDVLGNAVRPALAGAFESQSAQVLARGQPLGDEFLRVFVAQFVERKAAAVGDGDGLREHLPGIEPGETVQGAQVAFAVGVRAGTEFRDGGPVADRGDDVLEGLPARDMHVHVVAGHDGQTEAGRERQGVGGPVEVGRLEKDFERDPQVRQQGFQPPAFLEEVADRRRRGDPQRQAVLDAGIAAVVGEQVVEPQGVLALRAAAPSPGDEFRELSVCLPGGREQHQMHISPGIRGFSG